MGVLSLSGQESCNALYIDGLGGERHIKIHLHIHPIMRGGIEGARKAQGCIRRQARGALDQPLYPRAGHAQTIGKIDGPMPKGAR